MEKQEKEQYEKWRGEANRKYAGKWIYNEKREQLFLVDEVVECKYGFYDGPDAYKYHRFIPPRIRQYMAYGIRAKAAFDIKCRSAYYGPMTVVLIGIMDDGWMVVEPSFIVDEASKVIERVNEQIAKEQATVDTLKKIIENVTDRTEENANG